MHAVIHRLSTWLSTALSVHIAIYEIYSEDTTGHRITTSADAGMMFVGSYRKVRASVSSDTYPRFIRYEHPCRPIHIANHQSTEEHGTNYSLNIAFIRSTSALRSSGITLKLSNFAKSLRNSSFNSALYSLKSFSAFSNLPCNKRETARLVYVR